MIRAAAPARRVPAWLHGALLGAWCAGVPWAYAEWAMRGFGVVETGPHAWIFGLRMALPWFADDIGWPMLGEPGIVFGLAVTTGTAIGATLGFATRALRVDVADHARDAFWWPLRRVRGFWTAAIAVPVAWLAMFFGASEYGWSFERLALPGAALVAWYVLLPFGIVRREVAEEPRGTGWWRPRWPGTGAVLAYVVLALASWLLGFAWELPLGACSVAATCVAGVAFAGVGIAGQLVLGVAAVRALMDRVPLRRLDATQEIVLNWRVLGAFLSLSVRTLVAVLLWTLVPCLVAIWFLAQDYPTLVFSLRGGGGSLTPASAVAVRFLESAVTWGWVVALFPVALFVWLTNARLYARLVPAGQSKP